MPRNPRDYQKERKYDSKPSVKKKRAARGRARYRLLKLGRVSIGDGKDVAHKDNNTGNNSISNLKVSTQRANRSFKRNKNAKRK